MVHFEKSPIFVYWKGDDEIFVRCCRIHRVYGSLPNGLPQTKVWGYWQSISGIWFPNQRCGQYPAKDFIAGPLHGIYKDCGKWEFTVYASEIRPLFEQSKKNEREKMYNIFISNMLQNSDDQVIANYYRKIYYY